ncbi:MAG: TetR/AcrR family transcriptional regulator [Bacteroidota bacterium]
MGTQQRVIEAASSLFITYGIRSVTMDDIANELSISKKTIYQFFKDKNEIVKTCTQSILLKEQQIMEEIINSSVDVMDELIMTIEYFKKFMRRFNPTLLADLEKYYPEGWQEYMNHKETCFKTNFMHSMKRGIKEGYFRDDFDLDILAKLRMEQVELAFNQKVFPHHKYDLYEIQLQFTEHFMLGISTIKGYKRIQAYKESQKKKI